jgi:GDPmannose 4,6-dehydratase
MKKSALITGINGQDGSYLAELLLDKGYSVHGIIRRGALEKRHHLKNILNHPRLNLHNGSLTDTAALYQIIKIAQPDEVYNLAAQSHVKVSFENPVETCDINALGTLRILDILRQLDMIPHTKFYQASTSELYGKVHEIPQSEKTPFHPRSPYGVGKLFAYWSVENYKESYGLFGCNGILFNHESPRRGLEFVTRKITYQLSEVFRGERSHVELGNLNARRDWGHAKDYVYGMWQMLQHKEPDNYVLATGETRTIREFVESAVRHVNKTIIWEGNDVNEVGRIDGKVVVKVNPNFYRPAEVDLLIGDPKKAETVLKWHRNYSFDDLVSEMMENDLRKHS